MPTKPLGETLRGMKLTMITVAGLFVFLGCQSFRYHDPQKPHRGATQFYNNYDNSPKASFWKWQWERLTGPRHEEPPFNPPVLKTDTDFLRQNKNETTLTWIGHSSFLLQLQGKNIVTDPVFSERVSPVSFMGPKRLVALPFELKELPPVDVVLISHCHYDHLDLKTLRDLNKQNQGKTLFLVPLGNADLLKFEGIENVKELDWWDQITLDDLTITFTPAQHWTQRTLWDRNQSLWGGWHVQSEKFKFFYAGDTGYSKDFSDVHTKFGNVDLALIPIGAYEPRWFMGQQHVDPDGAVKIHKDLHSRLSIGVHWGTFRLSDEPLAEPPLELAAARERAGISESGFRVMMHGEVLKLDNRK
ncbi:hypothetical metallo hydrolase [Bdellovibrio bacteriovorus HD100]|uniref:Hypothetical metallo hydrolase n=2 Tax=Bdellovibrio bacteriovorus TaxID=959 RepID=Q6MJC3_BDEBA|nr:hypothetical metallo hydrolase [Bdellovibrio bacteriovorus HD100]